MAIRLYFIKVCVKPGVGVKVLKKILLRAISVAKGFKIVVNVKSCKVHAVFEWDERC